MSTIIDGTAGITFPDASTQSKAVSQVTPFAVTASSIAGAELQLPEATANGVNYVAVKAPNTLAANTTFTLPAADGTSGQVLQTNASGMLSFGNVAAANGGTGLTSPGTAGNLLTSNGTAWTSAAAPAGGFSNYVVFTASGSFTVPAGITKALVTVVGGGGGGGTTSGAGGTGGTSSFVGPTTTSATGGAPGTPGGGVGAGGVGSGGDINGRGGNGLSNGSGPFGWGGASIFSLASANYNTVGILGAGGAGDVGGNGGGGGGTGIKMYTTLVPGTSYTVTIGAEIGRAHV